MKKLFALLTLAAMLCIWAHSALAAKPLDEIQNYEITVSPRADGTLDIAYHIEWKVLDDTQEGPLTWVKIGIANEYADELKAQSSAIRSIYLLSDNGQYVRLDLNREYHAGETAELQFSLHQKYMLTLEKDKKACSFTFTPGWFDEISTLSMKLLWIKGASTYSNADREDDNMLIWNASPGPGEKVTAIVRYPMDAFQIGSDTEKKEDNSNGKKSAVIFVGLAVFIIFVIWLSRRGGGYRGGFGHSPRIYAGNVPHSCACACACGCACACACAGGGRAGCSAKHFYKPALSVEKLQKALQADRK
jgi:hypothetical protein